jgi:RAB protein geranylgeranyltransferase component A
MEEVAPEYDVIVLGTGLTECVLSGCVVYRQIPPPFTAYLTRS